MGGGRGKVEEFVFWVGGEKGNESVTQIWEVATRGRCSVTEKGGKEAGLKSHKSNIGKKEGWKVIFRLVVRRDRVDEAFELDFASGSWKLKMAKVKVKMKPGKNRNRRDNQGRGSENRDKIMK